MREVSQVRVVVILWWGFLATNQRKVRAIVLAANCLISVGEGPLAQGVSRRKRDSMK